MARPRTIKLADGIVSLAGFPKEIGDALAAHIKNFGEPTIVVPPSASLLEVVPRLLVYEDHVLRASPANSAALTSKAIGVFKDGNDIHLVTVAYDMVSGEAQVETRDKADNNRDSSIKFKMAADKHGFIR